MSDQLQLIGKAKKPKAALPIADTDPVAHVIIDSPLPHLDRVFDYAIPAKMSADVHPGVRVRVRFAGKLTDAWVLSRDAHTDHDGELASITNVISPEVVLLPEVLELAKSVALRQAGTLSDVLRSAIPNRHATGEATVLPERLHSQIDVELGEWTHYRGGDALIQRTIDGLAPRASVAVTGSHAPDLIARYAINVANKDLGVLIVVPDRFAIDQVADAIKQLGYPDRCVTTVAADDGPQKRYTQWLRALRQSATIVIGTRSAVFAPVHKLSAICVWDSWNESLVDPQAPYWNAADVAAIRSQQQQTALMYIGNMVSTQTVALGKWCARIAPDRPVARDAYPIVESALDEFNLGKDQAALTARIPSVALRAIKKGLESGPVLVHVARPGYVNRLVCSHCRTPAECTSCHGALISTARTGSPTCSLCGHVEAQWRCTSCKRTELRMNNIGSERTAEELGRAFPGVPVRSSSGDLIIRQVENRPAIIVATSGAAPIGNYSAAVLLDGNAMLSRPDLRASEVTLAHWLEVVSMVRGRKDGGHVVVVAEPTHPAVQALIKNATYGFADAELEQRTDVALPPAVRLAVLTGALPDIDDVLDRLTIPVMKRGPVPVDEDKVRMLVSVPRNQALELGTALRDISAIRSAKKSGKPVNVRMDPFGLI